MSDSTLTETSVELHDALSKTLALTFGKEEILVDALHTGGGVMVCAADLSIDGRFMGRQLWLTREEGWYLGFYDYYLDSEDQGVVVSLPLSEQDADNPLVIAANVAAILTRLGCTKLQGE